MARRTLLRWTLFAILLAGLAFAGYWQFLDLYHFAVVQPGVLYRDGFQGVRRFRNAYWRYPFKSVINLQAEGELEGKYEHQVEHEKEFCAQNGIKYFEISMHVQTAPTREQVAQMVQIVSDPTNRPVFMHDSQGIVREGMMVAAWQIEKMGYDSERAIDEAIWWGHPPNPDTLEFIRTYQKLDAQPAQ